MSSLHHETLLGLDNVQLDLPVAPFPLRILAAFLDYIIFGLIIMALMALGLFGIIWSGARSAWLVAVFILGYFLIEYGYFVALEFWLGGQTPGKKVFGLRVVTRQGGRAPGGAILVRNAFRAVDIAIGVPFMIWSPLGQRIGDRLAETLVLETGRVVPEAMVRRVPSAWGPREIAVAEEFLRRSNSMDKTRAEELAGRILEAMERDSPGFLGPSVLPDPVERVRAALGVRES